MGTCVLNLTLSKSSSRCDVLVGPSYILSERYNLDAVIAREVFSNVARRSLGTRWRGPRG